MNNRLKRLEILLDSIDTEKGFIALCQYVSNYGMDPDRISYLRDKFGLTSRVMHIDILLKQRLEMSKRILQLEVLEARCFSYLRNLDSHLSVFSVKDVFKAVKSLQEEFEDSHSDIIDLAQNQGICSLHMKKMKYLLDTLHSYYDHVIMELIKKTERKYL